MAYLEWAVHRLHQLAPTLNAMGDQWIAIEGYQFNPGHRALSMTCREGLTTLPGHGQLVDL